MKKFDNNLTTPEQSKRLLELGMPAWTADFFYPTKKSEMPIIIVDINVGRNLKYAIPCWSVGRLIEIFETCTSTKFERWSHRGVIRPLLEDCIEHIEFALNPDTIMKIDFSKLEE